MTASKTAQTIRTAAPAAPVRAPAQPQMAPPMVARHALGARELARFAAGVSRDRTASAQAVRLVSRLPGRGAGMMLACQRAYGNAHVQRMIAGREHEDRAPRDRDGRPRPGTEVRAGTDEHQITHLSADRNAGTVEERRSPAAQTFRVSSPQDAAEKEAVNVARQVMRAPAPAATPGADEKTVHRAAAGPPQMSANTAAAIQSDLGAGTPLPREVRRFMEPRFRADFSRVKIHTGDRSAQLSRDLNAHAFTVNNHVFFGKDRYQPATDAGKELIAHELTHTIQQGGAAQRQAAETPVTESAGLQVQRDFSDDALAYVRDHLNVIPGFRMLTIILGSNPVTHEKVDASAANILRALIEFLPGGALISEALANAGVFDRAGTFVEAQVRTLGLAAGSLWNALMTLVHSVGIGDALDPGAVWNRAQRIFTEPIDRIIAFAKGLVSGIVTIIKDAILRPIAELAKGTAGYDLLKAVLGHDPITGDEVPQTAENILEPFMRLIGQEEIWENMKKAHAIPRAFAWFKGALAGVMGFVAAVPGRFKAAFLSLELADIVLVPRAFAKIAGAFAGLVGQFMSWAGGTIWNLLEIVFDSVSPGALAYVKKTGSALKGILQNPMPFVGNLAKAAKLGFLNFAGNIVGHLKSGLIDWLTGSLPGVYIPKAFELGEVAKFAFSVLGLTWANIRQKLVKAVGETAVKAMETGFDIVVTLVRDGPAAAWDKIKEQLGNLKDMVIGGITDFVVDAIVKKAVPKLVAMFIPGAGFISAIVSIYDVVMTFVNRLKQIGQVVMAFVDSLVAIAAGMISPAAARIESTLAGLLSLAISFFAGFVGLGNVAEKIRGVIEKIRAPIDKALDWLIGWIVSSAKKLFAKAFVKDKDNQDNNEETPVSKEVKAKVGAELQGKQIADKKEEEALISAVYSKYKPQGLKSIKFQSVSGTNSMDVIVSASLAQRVTSLTVNDAKKLITIANKMSPYARSTTIYVSYDDGKVYGGPVVNSKKEGHAETRFKNRVLPGLLDTISKNRAKLKTPPDEPVPVTLDINRTPCDGCAIANLVAIASAAPKHPNAAIRLIVNASAVTKASWQSSDQTSVEALIAMRQKGIEINASSVWTIIKAKLKTFPQIEYEGKMFDDSNMDTFINEAANVQQLLDEAATKINAVPADKQLG